MAEYSATAWPACSIAEAHAQLTAPGSTFAIGAATINGNPLRIWQNAPPTLLPLLQFSQMFGDRTFIVHENERVSFAQHAAAVARLAARFRDDGIAKGDRVAIIMRNLPEWPVAF